MLRQLPGPLVAAGPPCRGCLLAANGRIQRFARPGTTWEGPARRTSGPPATTAASTHTSAVKPCAMSARPLATAPEAATVAASAESSAAAHHRVRLEAGVRQRSSVGRAQRHAGSAQRWMRCSPRQPPPVRAACVGGCGCGAQGRRRLQDGGSGTRGSCGALRRRTTGSQGSRLVMRFIRGPESIYVRYTCTRTWHQQWGDAVAAAGRAAWAAAVPHCRGKCKRKITCHMREDLGTSD